jgi:hypothetical protein
MAAAKQRKGRSARLAEDGGEPNEGAYEAAQTAIEDGLDEAHRYLKRQWRERPVAVAAAALGFGIVIGLLLGSRR